MDKLMCKLITLFIATSIWTQSAHALDLFGTLANIFDLSKQRTKTYQESTDKALTDQFYYISADGKNAGLNKDITAKTKRFEFMKLTPSSITLRQLMYSEGNMQAIYQDISGYSYDPTSDEISKRYISFAESRGDVVKLYKPVLGNYINQIFNQNFYLDPAQNTRQWIGLDNALIEFSPKGRIISFLTRSHQALASIGANSYQYINIYFGPENSQVLENRVGNDAFQNNYIRVVSSTRSNGSNGKSLSTKLEEPNNGQTDSGAVPQSVPIKSLNASATDTSALNVEEHRIQLLKNLEELRKEGVLTDQEFAEQKKKILSN